MTTYPAESREATSSPQAGADILIVDDNPADLRVLSDLLSGQGYRPRVAVGALQGLKAARLAPPDLVLLDVVMPDMDGYQVCRQLKADPATRSVPVMFLSSLDSTGEKVRAFEAGGEDYIAKPFQAAEVLARVRTHLGRRQAEAELKEANQRLQAQVAEIEALQAELQRQTEEQIRKLSLAVEQSPSLVLITDAGGAIQYVNSTFTRVTGCTLAEVAGRTFCDLQEAGAESDLCLRVREAIATGSEWRGEFQDRRKGGQPFWARMVVSPIRSPDGIVTHFVQVEEDITERRLAEEDANRQATLARALLRTAARLNAWLDLDTVARTVCEETAGALGVPVAVVLLYDENDDEYRLAAAVGLPLELLEDVGPIQRRAYDALVAEMDSLVIGDSQGAAIPALAGIVSALGLRAIATTRLSRDGEPVGVLIAGTAGKARSFSRDELVLLNGLADHAAQAIANAGLFGEVRAGREQLRALSLQLMESQEAERRAIARELHDEIGQLLTGLKLTLGVSRQLPPGPIAASVAEARALTEELLGRVRELSLDLRPSILDDLGLLPALLSLFERYTARTQVHVVFRQAGVESRRFDPGTETAAYRIVQEALTNVARHAGVREAEVRILASQESLEVQVEDRGAGFSPEAMLAAGTSGGLSGMRERVRLIGGSLAIESTPGGGTRVACELPSSTTLAEKRGNDWP